MDGLADQLDSIGDKILQFFDPDDNFAGSTKVSLFQGLLSNEYAFFNDCESRIYLVFVS
jgi:hypothetical protein